MLFKINFKDGKISSHLRLVTKTGKAFFWSWWLEWWTRGSHSMIVATSISISRTKTIEKKKIYSSSQSHSRTWRQFWNLFLLALALYSISETHAWICHGVCDRTFWHLLTKGSMHEYLSNYWTPFTCIFPWHHHTLADTKATILPLIHFWGSFKVYIHINSCNYVFIMQCTVFFIDLFFIF